MCVPVLYYPLCEGVQCATMTHVWKLERHWRDVGRSDPAGAHFGCTADDAGLCYGNRYSDMRSVYCGGQQCNTPDQAGPCAKTVCS